MQVKFFMTPDPIVIDAGALVEEARDTMVESAIRHLPVVEDEQLVGVISQRDVGNASIAVLGMNVSAVMASPPLTIGPDETVVDAARLMLARSISGLPVVAEDGALVGIITTTNCLVAMVQFHHELTIEGKGQ